MLDRDIETRADQLATIALDIIAGEGGVIEPIASFVALITTLAKFLPPEDRTIVVWTLLNAAAKLHDATPAELKMCVAGHFIANEARNTRRVSRSAGHSPNS
jgi:hypothetical protein